MRTLIGICGRGLTPLIMMLLAACEPTFDHDARLSIGAPTRAQVADVPLIEQADFYCGPASIAMVMQWAGADISQAEVAALAFSPDAGGTYLADMAGSARRLGQVAVQIDAFDDLITEINAGHPVIVFQNLGLVIAPVWHYGVVTGYDFAEDEVYLNSGQLEQMVLPFGVFDRTWARGGYWGLVVLPPGELSASASEAEILSAGAALERANQFAAAETLYQTGAIKWPGNWLWQFGLANARFGQGDLRGARIALQRASILDPSIPEIRANLAHVEAQLTDN